jgi:hydrogenase nickel incorporation protein HypA/HybF
MNEDNIAAHLLRRVTVEAGKARLLRVTGVEVEVGVLQSVEPDLLKDAFLSAAKGSLADGAELNLSPVKAEACCLVCGEVYEPAYADFQCPACGLAEPQILKGHSLALVGLTGPAARGGGHV